MPLVYPINEEQANALTGQWFADDCYFNPTQDAVGWFITDGEINECVNPECMWVKDLTETREYVMPDWGDI